MMKIIWIIIICIIIIVLLTVFIPRKQNVFVLTVDDIALNTPDQINTTKEIISLLEKHDMTATFFAIPAEMERFDFPESIEISQHGYTHCNEKLDSYAEFKNLTDEEVEKRLLEGKSALEYLGYEPKGFRAPCLSFKKRYLKFMKKYYEYDASFLLPQGDKFTIPIIWII
jgi:peptidoglycan/xylan/chitin deacetylase (PgdA/CDA1 family)